MLIDYLEQKNQQTSVFYILSSSIYENNNGNYITANNTISNIINKYSINNNNNKNNNHYNDSNDYSKISKKLIINNKHDICGVADELSLAYNKTIYIWPCPKMKVSLSTFTNKHYFFIYL